MPYKTEGNKVMVKKDGKWKVLKEHPTKAQAVAHVIALKTNVEES